jgi:hypothetical protein
MIYITLIFIKIIVFEKYNKISILKHGKCIYCISSNKYIWLYDVYFLCKTVRNKISNFQMRCLGMNI